MDTEFDKNEEIITGLATLRTDELKPMVKKSAPSFKESLANLLSMPVDKDAMGDLLQNSAGTIENPTMSDYLAATMIMKASLGDTKAYEVIRDTCGQKPVDRVEQDTVMPVVMEGAIQEYGE